MNFQSRSRHFPVTPALALLAFSGAIILCHWFVWTPIERYYFGTYLESSWLGNDPLEQINARWLYKTAPRRKKELALVDDVVPTSNTSNRDIPMQLSLAARNSGGLV